jgi:hypothetical protein
LVQTDDAHQAEAKRQADGQQKINATYAQAKYDAGYQEL